MYCNYSVLEIDLELISPFVEGFPYYLDIFTNTAKQCSFSITSKPLNAIERTN